MQKTVSIFLILLALTGCATTTSSSQKERAEKSSFESKETLLIQAKNREQLIQLYKNRLKEKDDQDVRVSLIEAYLAQKDYDSADFHLSQFPPADQQTDHTQKPESIKSAVDMQAKIHFLRAKVLLAQGKLSEAAEQANQALVTKSNYPEAENLMGLIQAEGGHFVEARAFFNQARSHYYDDVIVKNNLAVLDLIEGDYQAVVEKLQPLYMKGQADEKVASNLVVAYTKLGNYQAVEDILKKQDYTAGDIQRVFIGLKASDNIAKKAVPQPEVMTPEVKTEIAELKEISETEQPGAESVSLIGEENQQPVSEEKRGLSDSEEMLALMLENYIHQAEEVIENNEQVTDEASELQELTEPEPEEIMEQPEEMQGADSGTKN